MTPTYIFPQESTRLPSRQIFSTSVSLITAVSVALGLLTTQGWGADKPTFRKSQIDLASSKAQGGPAVAPQPGDTLAAPALQTKSTQRESEDLNEKRQTLITEVRYAKAKLEAVQKQFALQTAAGDLEKAERLDQEVKDWQGRYATTKAQLDELEKQVSDGSPSRSTPAEEVIVPGENLEVFVNEDPSFNGIYQVRRGGYIIMPQVGRIAVAGKPLSAAEAAVKRALQSSQLHNASVMIERKQGADIENGPLIYLSGEFRSPGQWHIPSGITPTLVNVILSSGGVSDKADLTRVRVMRMAASKSVVEEVNVAKILEGGGLTSDITLGEGDVITLPAGPSNLVYLTGNVARQGSFPLKPGERISAYAAILQNGGFARFADQKGVYVLRALPDGTKAKLPVDVAAIKKGQRPDVQLQSNDILVVPEKWFSW